jgi:NADH-quinone oxidoreductase subunit E
MPDVAEIQKTVTGVLEKHGRQSSLLVSILQDIQEELSYLPEEALTAVSEGLKLPQTRVYSVATFFRAFSLTPRGKHVVHVCMGTACHVRGAAKIMDKLERDLCVCSGGTTDDGNFTVETVNCVGACALGPMVVVDGKYHGQMTTPKVDKMLKKYAE